MNANTAIAQEVSEDRLVLMSPAMGEEVVDDAVVAANVVAPRGELHT